MISSDTAMLMKLDSLRIKSTYLFLMVVLMLLAIVGQHDLTEELYSGFHFVLPFVAGILFSVGLIADDLQQKTWPGILSLPVSRKRIWKIRVINRFTVYLSLLALWLIIPLWFPMESPWVLGIDWSHQETSPVILVLAGFMAFAVGLFFSNFMRNTFESAMAAASGSLILFATIRNVAKDWSLVMLSIIAIIIVGAAARNLFLCREPLDFSALASRVAVWMMIFAAVITPLSFIF